jgi:hypothetical protein
MRSAVQRGGSCLRSAHARSKTKVIARRCVSLYLTLRRLLLKYGLSQFNVFWLNPEVPETFPRGLLDALEDDAYTLASLAVRQRARDDIEARLRASMQADALQPLQPLDGEDELVTKPQHRQGADETFDEETVEQAKIFLRSKVCPIA